jgi:hypothetical protein
MKQKYLNQLYVELYNLKNPEKQIIFSEKDVSYQDLVNIMMVKTDLNLYAQSEYEKATILELLMAKYLPFLREEIIYLLKDSYKGRLSSYEALERNVVLNMITFKSSASILRIFEVYINDLSENAFNRQHFLKSIRNQLVNQKATHNEAYANKIDVIANKIFDLSVEKLNKYKNNYFNEALEQETLTFIIKVAKSFPSLKDKLLNIITPYLSQKRTIFYNTVFLGFYKLSINFLEEMISLVESYKKHENSKIAHAASKTIKEIQDKVIRIRKQKEEDEAMDYDPIEDYHEEFDYEDDAVALTLNGLI